MSILKASKLATANGTIWGTPINIESFQIPSSSATNNGGYVDLLNGTLDLLTFANTAQFHYFTYYPKSNNSWIAYQAMLDVDSNNSTGYPEQIVIFVNNIPISTSYHYRRVAGHEPYCANQSGTYTYNDGSPITFSIRGKSQNGTLYLGTCLGGSNQSMANTITIFEVQK